MIVSLLIVHILIGFGLVASFAVRYVGLLTGRLDSGQGRGLILGLGTALVASGIGLVIVAHSTITGACLSSLGIIAVIGVLEAGLYGIGKRVPARNR